jgi:hypothetical protein
LDPSNGSSIKFFELGAEMGIRVERGVLVVVSHEKPTLLFVRERYRKLRISADAL